jgi:mannan endo-1,4-beta-mannosidase
MVLGTLGQVSFRYLKRPAANFFDQIYWQFIPGDDGTETCNSGCCTGYDGFEIGLDSGKGDIATAIANANSKMTVQKWGFV